MNGDLIDILELIVVLNRTNRQMVCNTLSIGITKCKEVECSECLLNTSKMYITDYPIQIIEIKGVIDGQ